MSNIDQFQFGLSRYVPEGSIPLAYLDIPTLFIGENLKLIGTGSYVSNNSDYLSIKKSFPSISFSWNTYNFASVSGVISNNKVADPSFLYGLYPSSGASWSVVSGVWEWSLENGRTSKNSFYGTEDSPSIEQGNVGEKRCVLISWSNGTSQAKIASSFINITSSGLEGKFSRDDVVYQLSVWISTDPVDSYKVRRGPDPWMEQDATKTAINLSVIGANSTGGVEEVLWSGDISWADLTTRSFINQPRRVYLRYRSKYFKAINPQITQVRIEISGESSQGVYFDDVRLRSYYYKSGTGIGVNKTVSQQEQNEIKQETVTGPNLILDPEFIDNNFDSGDFDNFFRNKISDYSFENNKWTTYSGGTIKSGQDNLGLPRSGNRYLEIDNSNEGAYIDLTGLDNSKVYKVTGWHRAEDLVGYQSGNSSKRSVFKIELRNSSNTLLATLVSPQVTGGNFYELASWTWSSSGYPTTVKWRVKIECVSAGGFSHGHIWDDIFLYEDLKIIPSWSFTTSSKVSGAYQTLVFGEANNKFGFEKYIKDGPTKFHFIYSWRTIYKNNTYQLSEDFCNRYFNTEHIAVSSNSPIVSGGIYGLGFLLYWKGAVAGITLDMDPTVRGAFAEPFKISVKDNKGNISLKNINNYGSLIVLVEGINASGGVSEIALTHIISPEKNNLPSESFVDQKTEWNYAPITSPRFSFSSPFSVSGRVTLKFRANSCGVGAISLNRYTVTSSGISISAIADVSLYSFGTKIEIDRLYEEEGEAWRVGIKDGIFERDYTITSLEPSGSWLRKVGFKDGDEVTLIYTVPEYNLGSQWIPNDSSNIIKHLQEVHKKTCDVLDEKTISLGTTDVEYLTELVINNTIYATGIVGENISSWSNVVENIDLKNGLIKLKYGISTRDIVQVSFFYRESRFIYRGFYDGASWNDLDLNPSAEHRWNVALTSLGSPGYEISNKPITIYLLPTAAYLSTGNVTGTILFKSAFDLPPNERPLSFVRHDVGVSSTEEYVSKFPSAVIIGKILITSPGEVTDVGILDIRSRGGGLPEEIKTDVINRPIDFIEETRFKIPGGSTINTKVKLYLGDDVSIKSFGTVKLSGGGKLNSTDYLYVSVGTPASGELIGSSWNKYISTTYPLTGNIFIRSSSASGVGDFYVVIRIKRKFEEGNNWDIQAWDGEPVMLNGVVVIEVPAGILTGEGGYQKLTSQEVEDIVKKHVAAGVHYIIRYV